MSRKMKLEVGGLNIRVHPHSPDRYRELFRRYFALKRVIPIRGDRSGLITALKRVEVDARYINGVLTTFLDIDMEGRWLNTDTLEEASTNDLEQIRLPENLRPNSRQYYFRFDVERHELVFEHYTLGYRLSHKAALDFFKGLSKQKRIFGEFGDIKITIIQTIGSIDRIFSIPRIADINVYIERPNADLWGRNFEQQAEEHLEDKNARSMNVNYKSERGLGITRDEDLDALVRASIGNGRTVASGYGDNGHMVVTTDRYPKIIQDKYDDDEESNGQVFERLANLFRR